MCTVNCLRPLPAKATMIKQFLNARVGSGLPKGLKVVARRWYAQAAAQPLHSQESFLSGSNGIYVEEMYRAWKADAKSVHKSWDVYFRNLDAGVAPFAAYMPPPGLVSPAPSAAIAAVGQSLGGQYSVKEIQDHLAVQALVRAYQVRGHNVANLDPLGMYDADLSGETPLELIYTNYGFTEADLDREFYLGTPDNTGILGSGLTHGKTVRLRDLITQLESIYCKNIGYEYMHINDKEKCNWLRERIENPQSYSLDAVEKKVILARLCQADGFERFLQTKWSAEKRFGVEGLEAAIPALKSIVDHGSEQGIETVVFGMPHRGRLNVLGNVIKKPLEFLFSEFNSDLAPADEGSGDVKYHLGSSHDRITRSGKKIHLSLVANPSHLEAVDPVVVGKVRAEQFLQGDTERKKVMGLLLHGDAAFSGQGIVYETFNLGDLPNYCTGGTIHVVCNNQIGFTTDPRFSRSSPYCSDIAKCVDAPIFHVNGDDVESVVKVCKLAVDWRQKFGKDVVIDIVGYRRHGHNEIDQPAFTQPLMYAAISKHRPVLQIYRDQLLKEGVITPEEFQAMDGSYQKMCQDAYERSKSTGFHIDEWLDSRWKGMKSRVSHASIFDTGVPKERLHQIGQKISNVPADFTPHSGITRFLKARQKCFETGKDIDWATAESLAFGSLLLEDYHVRLSGQDVERGTFSQRHVCLTDQKTEKKYTALQNLSPDQAPFTVANSSLSEYGCLGFELGYSLANPNALVMWEAQFGDFSNGCQIIFDQFISSMEQKWLRQTGITLLLPHGYEGAGPEHSSARLERFLQMSDDADDVIPDLDGKVRKQIQDTNWQVMMLSTPANYFHALRRQLHREFRKPLIIMTPKSLLRLRACVSSIDDVAEGTRFRRLIHDETFAEPSADVKRLIFCSGKVKYDLLKARDDAGLGSKIAIASVEQISPFPFDLVRRQAEMFPNADIVWCQEEPKNMGAWSYVNPRIETALKPSSTHNGARPKYVGRKPSAATATGNKKQHKYEEHAFLEAAMTI
eukprot:comp23327_c1_seq1/m.38418 comp23327_c1_seq1/g.38418  ORF comp23327_c1_seq1/g.38418 comp23327_c1_seq1/m.38418 type:complete len:1020 (-) comp23327_c1_seq1:250-3309(-)